MGVECPDTVTLALQPFDSVVRRVCILVQEMLLQLVLRPEYAVDGVQIRVHVDFDVCVWDFGIRSYPGLLGHTGLAGSWQCMKCSSVTWQSRLKQKFPQIDYVDMLRAEVKGDNKLMINSSELRLACREQERIMWTGFRETWS